MPEYNKHRYFDSDRFKEILEIEKWNPFLALEELRNYLKDYPLDYSAKAYYLGFLITVGETDSIEESINALLSEANQNPKYSNRMDALKINLN